MQNQDSTVQPTSNSLPIGNAVLGDVLLSLGKKSIYIPDYIKANAKTRKVPLLKKQFEDLIRNDKRFYGSRTSEIFHLKELKRLPKVWGYWMSHINIA